MSTYYNATRTRGLYDPAASEPFKVSRSKLELFLECPRCFYLDRRLGVGRPPGYPFNLNSAVDTLLKKEFDAYRVAGTKHPLQKHYGIDAIPVAHDDLDQWRHNFTGVQHLHALTNILFYGAIDDLWQDSAGNYIVVDYKATAKDGEIVALDAPWHGGYKRQMEMYQWLLRKKGLPVSSTGYFVYCNGQTDREAFDARLEFAVTLIPYTGDDSWVENALRNAWLTLKDDAVPLQSEDCDYCSYTDARVLAEKGAQKERD